MGADLGKRGLRHLSLTGPHAGARLCGAGQDEPAWHAGYLEGPLWRESNLCPECVRVWVTDDEPEERN